MLLNQYLLTSFSNFSVFIEFLTPKNGTINTNFVSPRQAGCLKVSAPSSDKALNVLYFKSLSTKTINVFCIFCMLRFLYGNKQRLLQVCIALDWIQDCKNTSKLVKT